MNNLDGNESKEDDSFLKRIRNVILFLCGLAALFSILRLGIPQVPNEPQDFIRLPGETDAELRRRLVLRHWDWKIKSITGTHIILISENPTNSYSYFIEDAKVWSCRAVRNGKPAELLEMTLLKNERSGFQLDITGDDLLSCDTIRFDTTSHEPTLWGTRGTTLGWYTEFDLKTKEEIFSTLSWVKEI